MAISLQGTVKSATHLGFVASESVTFDSIPADDDFIYLFVGSDDTGAPQTPAGFASLQSITNFGPGSGKTLTLYRRKAASEASATYTVTFASNNFRGGTIGFVLRGVDTTTPEEVNTAGTQAFSATATAPDITTLSDNAWHIALFGAKDTDWSAISYPAGYTGLARLTQMVAAAYKVITPAGATGAQTMVAAGANYVDGISLSIKPFVVTVPDALPPSGLIVAWPGTAASIPAGWSRVTGLDSKIPIGASVAGSTGGSDSHTHVAASHSHTDTHQHTKTTAASGSNNTGTTATTTAASGTHTHVITLSAATTSRSAASGTSNSFSGPHVDYYSVIWIKSDGTTAIPAGAVLFWGASTGTIPSTYAYANGAGGTPDLRSKFLRGAAAAGDGGSATSNSSHTHTHAHTHAAGSAHGHTAAVGAASASNNSGSGTGRSPTTHTHTYSTANVGTTSAAFNSDSTASGTASATGDPPHIKLHHVYRTGTGGAIPVGLIALWDGLAAAIPSGWARCDGNNGTPNLNASQFVKGSAADGDQGTTGGANSHSHTLSHSHTSANHTHTMINATAAAAGTGVGATTGTNTGTTTTHTHTADAGGTGSSNPTGSSSTDGESLDSAADNNLPAYSTVLFIQKYTPASLMPVRRPLRIWRRVA